MLDCIYTRLVWLDGTIYIVDPENSEETDVLSNRYNTVNRVLQLNQLKGSFKRYAKR